MTSNKILPVFFMVLIALILCSFVTLKENDPSSLIPLEEVNLHLQDNGTLHVKEIFHYSSKRTGDKIENRIPITDEGQLQNINVSTQGAYSNFSVEDRVNAETLQESAKVITVNLFSDPQKTTPISNKDVNVTFEYDLLNSMVFYNDAAELKYQISTNSYGGSIGRFNVNVHVKSSDGVQYWLNPPYYAENSNWQNNTLQINSKNIPYGNSFEVMILIPRNQFAANPTNGVILDYNNLSAIEKAQNDYQNPIYFKMNLYSALAVLILLGSFVPFFIYLCYGREPKINYETRYEVDLPTDDPPAIVNAICRSEASKKVGEPDIDGFMATIMDLIDRNYLLTVDNPSDNNDLNSDELPFLEISPDYDTDTLWKFEEDILKFLKEHEQDGIISLGLIFESLEDLDGATFFKETYKNWKKEVRQALLDNGSLKGTFSNKGDRYLKIFGILGLVAAPVIFIHTFVNPIPSTHVLILSIILGLTASVSLIMPQEIAGQWTIYGREYYAQWQSFKRYIEDFSLIKEHPPESVKIWDKYLVYATALGAADGVRKAMEISIPKYQLEGNDLYGFHYYDSPSSLLKNAIVTALGLD